MTTRFSRRTALAGGALLASAAAMTSSGLYRPTVSILSPEVSIAQPAGEVVKVVSRHQALGEWMAAHRDISAPLADFVPKIAAAQSPQEAALLKASMQGTFEKGMQAAAKLPSIHRGLAENSQRLHSLLGRSVSPPNRAVLRQLATAPRALDLAGKKTLEELKLRGLRNEGMHTLQAKFPELAEEKPGSETEASRQSKLKGREENLSDDTLTVIETMRHGGPLHHSLRSRILEERLADLSPSASRGKS